MPISRRGLLTKSAVGAAFAKSSKPSEFQPQMLSVSKLRVGDIITGPSATVVRVAQITRLSNGRIRIEYTDPGAGKNDHLPVNGYNVSGFAASKQVLVYARGVSEAAAQLALPVAPSPPATPSHIDGGTP